MHAASFWSYAQIFRASSHWLMLPPLPAQSLDNCPLLKLVVVVVVVDHIEQQTSHIWQLRDWLPEHNESSRPLPVYILPCQQITLADDNFSHLPVTWKSGMSLTWKRHRNCKKRISLSANITHNKEFRIFKKHLIFIK